MAIPKLIHDVEVHQKQTDRPSMDNPSITATEMKRIFDSAAVTIKNYINGELIPSVDSSIEQLSTSSSDKVSKANVITKDNVEPYYPTYTYNPATKHYVDSQIEEQTVKRSNTTAYTPTSDYNPATKKYVDEKVSQGTTGFVTEDMVLTKGNTNPYNPASDYNPATKQYVDLNVGGKNAEYIHNIPVNVTGIEDKFILVYDAETESFIAKKDEGGGGGGIQTVELNGQIQTVELNGQIQTVNTPI